MTEVLRLEARRCWFILGIGGSCGKPGAEQVALHSTIASTSPPFTVAPCATSIF